MTEKKPAQAIGDVPEKIEAAIEQVYRTRAGFHSGRFGHRFGTQENDGRRRRLEISLFILSPPTGLPEFDELVVSRIDANLEVRIGLNHDLRAEAFKGSIRSICNLPRIPLIMPIPVGQRQPLPVLQNGCRHNPNINGRSPGFAGGYLMFSIELRKSCHDRPNDPSHFVGLSRSMEGARDGAGSATGRWQDKRPHGALRSGSCIYWVF